MTNNIKIILTEGDSWTAGDIIDPKLEARGITNIDHRDNDAYRLPKVWPDKLSKLTNIEVRNTSHAGSSNDGIEKRVISQVGKLLEKYNSDEIFVIVGWTSPERKDFYYKDIMDESDTGRWETIYPLSPFVDLTSSGFDEFSKLYTTYFWNQEEYIMRYLIQNINIHTYLNSHNIKHIFFDAFYETFEATNDAEKHGILDSVNLIKAIKRIPFSSDDLQIKKQYIKLRKSNFIDITFKEFILTTLKEHKRVDLFDNHHPTELSHQKWANYLYERI
tara:strand:+ start:3263 stop:4087 length:825 start_codon:yes stop_codon:yes gene_type:complete